MQKTTAKHIAIIGPSGTGKTYLLKKRLQGGGLTERLMILDLENAYGDVPGVVRVRLDDAIRAVQSHREAGVSPPFRWRVVPGIDRKRDIEHFFWLAMCARDVWVVAEEMGEYRESERLRWCFTTGRGRGVKIVALAQRPYQITPTNRAQLQAAICFATDEPTDAEYMAERFGREVVAEMASLDREKNEFCLMGDLIVVEEVMGIKINQKGGEK